MRQLIALLLLALAAAPAGAESCGNSLNHIINDLPGGLPRPASDYQALLRACQQALSLPNVRDAYILRDGGIAVLPRDQSIMATAETLAAFCRAFPRDTLRFITRRETRRGLTTGLVVLMSSTHSTSCPTILGNR